MFSVIRTGGKQYVVRPGDTLHVEKLETKDGATIKFDEVLLHFDGKKITLGTPTVAKATVEAKVVTAVSKDDKVHIIKHHRRKRYFRRKGHRQKKTIVEVTKL